LCAGGISGLGASVSQLAGAAALTNEMCDPVGKDAIPPNTLPHNLGQPEAGRRLEAAAAGGSADSAHARRLLFGGGYRADETQCFVDASSVAWWLAQAGLALNAAANGNAGKSCDMGMLLKSDVFDKGKMGDAKDDVKQWAQASCAVDVAGAIFAFGQAIMFLQFAVVHCPDQLNTNALCGAGIDGMVSSLAGMASTISSFGLTCFKLGMQDGHKKKKAAVNLANALSKIFHTEKHNKLSTVPLDLEGNFGRRLSAYDDEVTKIAAAYPSGEAGIAELKKRFTSPQEAWKSIGYDFAEANAEWRKSSPQRRAGDLVSLMEEPVATAEERSVLGGLQMCTPRA